MFKMKKLIIWSGGFDSTALLLECFKNRIDFDTAYINLKNNESKVVCEKLARNKFKENFKDLFSKDYKDYEFGPIDIYFKGDLTNPWQPILWLLGYISGYKYDFKELYDEIWFGYIQQDDFWHFKENFLSVYKTFCYHWMINDIPLKFPFEWVNKDDLYSKYYKSFVNSNDSKLKKILYDIWTCENPRIKYNSTQLEFDFKEFSLNTKENQNYEPCGYCDTCKKFKIFLNNNNLEKELHSYYKNINSFCDIKNETVQEQK